MRFPRTRYDRGPDVRLLSAVAFIAVLVLRPDGAALRAQSQPALPARFDSYVKAHVKLTSDQHRQLLAGQPVTQLLETDPAKEVAIFGAVWVNAPVARYLSAVKDIESFEKGGNFLVTKRISSPPRLEDFGQLSLPPDDVADLRACKVGECEVKLGETALKRIQKETDWAKPNAAADVERSMRRLAHEYVTAYLEGGNSRLAVYRDLERPTFVAQEFAAMVNRMPEMTNYLPGLKKYLLDYPKVTLPNAESFLYWQNAKFGLKPTIRINHLTIADQRSHVTVVSKMLRQPLLLDRHRTARAGAGSGAWRRILVRQRQSQPIGRTERLRRLRDPQQGAQRGRKRDGGCARDHQEPNGTAITRAR